MITTRAVSLAVLAAMLVTACSLPSSLPVTTTVTGILVDAADQPVPGAVIFAPSASGISAPDVGVDQTGGNICESPNEDHVARTCTDATGAFSITLNAPLSATLELTAKRWHRTIDLSVELGFRVPETTVEAGTVKQPAMDPADEIEAAVAYALPSLASFELITFEDEFIITALENHTRTNFTEALAVSEFPILQPDDGTQDLINVIAYRFEPRADGIQDCAYDPAANKDQSLDEHTDCESLPNPSQTFRGMPEMSVTEIEGFAGDENAAAALEDETTYQMSVLNIVDDELDFTYYGNMLEAPYTPSSMQGLKSVLSSKYPATEVARLAALTDENYVLHNQFNLDVEYIKASIPDEDDYVETNSVSSNRLAPSNHFAEDGGPIRTIRMVAVADPTVKNIDDDTVLAGYYGRVDAMVNRMDLFYRYVQIDGTTPGTTTLTEWGNAFLLRAQLVEHRHLTSTGLDNHSFATTGCGDPSSYLNNLRGQSASSTSVNNEFWMWFTNTTNYPGLWGCMYLNGMGSAPNFAAVGFVSLRDYTLETVGQTLMHEVGHNLNAIHGVAPSSHRCKIIGIIPFGVTGPGIMGATSDRNLRTNCFGVTGSSSTTKGNVTRIAEVVDGLPE